MAEADAPRPDSPPTTAGQALPPSAPQIESASGIAIDLDGQYEVITEEKVANRAARTFFPQSLLDLAPSLRPPLPTAKTSPLHLAAGGRPHPAEDQNSTMAGPSNFSPLASLTSPTATENLPRPVQERCFTWCTQREDNHPFCKMLCLRKRTLQPSPDKSLSRYNGQRSTRLPLEKTGESSSAPWRSLFTWTPFANFRRRLEPYSIVYLRGYFDGPLGRYMEELEQDDGHRDFGHVSRGTMAERKQRDDIGMRYMDWQEEGSLLYLPLTSLFKPVLDIPNTCDRLFTPAFNFLTMYRRSFTDGTQQLYFRRLKEHIQSGEVKKFGSGFLSHIEEIEKKGRKEREERYNAQQEAIQKAKDAVESKTGDSESVVVITSDGIERVTQADKVKRSLERAQKVWGDDADGKDGAKGGQDKRE